MRELTERAAGPRRCSTRCGSDGRHGAGGENSSWSGCPQAAAELLDVFAAQRLMRLLSDDDPALDEDGAYSLASEIHVRRVERGENPVGRKIGFTDRASGTTMRHRFGATSTTRPFATGGGAKTHRAPPPPALAATTSRPLDLSTRAGAPRAVPRPRAPRGQGRGRVDRGQARPALAEPARVEDPASLAGRGDPRNSSRRRKRQRLCETGMIWVRVRSSRRARFRAIWPCVGGVG